MELTTDELVETLERIKWLENYKHCHESLAIDEAIKRINILDRAKERINELIEEEKLYGTLSRDADIKTGLEMAMEAIKQFEVEE